MNGPLILLVEDDPAQADLFAHELADAGYQVMVVGGGHAAVAFAKQHRPAIVVLDIQLPDMDGLEALQRLLDIDRGLPVILHTAYSHYRTDLRTWSAAAYVVKSIDMEELKATLASVLQQPRQVHQPLESTERAA